MRRMSGESDEDDLGSRTRVLVAAARKGEAPAHRELVLRFASPLRKLLAARTPIALRTVTDVEDLAQDTWARAFAHLDTFEFRGVGSFWCWLRRIALNELAMQLRSRGAAKRGTAQALPESGVAPRTPAPGPHTQASRGDDLERIERALEALGARQREAVLLRIELDLSFDEIARECSFATPDAARMAVTRGVEQIASRLRVD